MITHIDNDTWNLIFVGLAILGIFVSVAAPLVFRKRRSLAVIEKVEEVADRKIPPELIERIAEKNPEVGLIDLICFRCFVWNFGTANFPSELVSKNDPICIRIEGCEPLQVIQSFESHASVGFQSSVCGDSIKLSFDSLHAKEGFGLVAAFVKSSFDLPERALLGFHVGGTTKTDRRGLYRAVSASAPRPIALVHLTVALVTFLSAIFVFGDASFHILAAFGVFNHNHIEEGIFGQFFINIMYVVPWIVAFVFFWIFGRAIIRFFADWRKVPLRQDRMRLRSIGLENVYPLQWGLLGTALAIALTPFWRRK